MGKSNRQKSSSHSFKKGTSPKAPRSHKFVCAGRGRVVNYPTVKKEIFRLTGKKNPSSIEVVYLGTPGYESQTGYDLQAKGFDDSGCSVTHLKLTQVKKSPDMSRYVAEALRKADVIVVSGGNTLYAMKQWKKLGVDRHLKTASDRGAVLCGGSAGAICWYEGGHSDSRDPTTLLHVDPNLTGKAKSDWCYINVKGLGLLKGVCCPHHDSVQSNGIPRSVDFDGMMKRQKFSIGICIDDQAALAIDGEKFKVIADDGTSKLTKKTLHVNGTMTEVNYDPDGSWHDLKDLETP